MIIIIETLMVEYINRFNLLAYKKTAINFNVTDGIHTFIIP